jgi:hypothetical protein
MIVNCSEDNVREFVAGIDGRGGRWRIYPVASTAAARRRFGAVPIDADGRAAPSA